MPHSQEGKHYDSVNLIRFIACRLLAAFSSTFPDPSVIIVTFLHREGKNNLSAATNRLKTKICVELNKHEDTSVFLTVSVPEIITIKEILTPGFYTMSFI